MPDSVWGVIDFVPDTDFPDIRAVAVVRSREAGSLFTIPREGGSVRFYIQQPAEVSRDLLDPATGRIDRDRSSPEKLLEQGKKIMQPYKIDIRDNQIGWWTVYAGERCAYHYCCFGSPF